MLEQTTFGASGHAIDNLHLFDGITDPIVVAMLTQYQDADDLISDADAALYRAKEAGRNQVAF